MKLRILALAAIAASSVGAAHADSFSFTGSLASTSPTFNRPLASPAVGLSAVGTAVYYETFTFTPSSGGSYNFLSTVTTVAAGEPGDNFTALYVGGFNPAAALTHLVVANDDDPSIGLSGFSTTLTAGLTYTFVTTSFSNGDAFRYADAITQTSTTAVPETGTLALMLTGLGMVGLLARRRGA